MKKNMSWKFTDVSSVTFQLSVSGPGEFGPSMYLHFHYKLVLGQARPDYVQSSVFFGGSKNFWEKIKDMEIGICQTFLNLVIGLMLSFSKFGSFEFQSSEMGSSQHYRP